MLSSLLVGAALTTIAVGVHVVGTVWLIGYLRKIGGKAAKDGTRFVLQLRILCTTALVLLSLHVLEVVVWAAAYLALPLESISTVEEAVYFSTVSFSSLGYGDVVIKNSWRLLGGIQSMTGLLLFGWSTALLFAVVQRIWERQQSERTVPK